MNTAAAIGLGILLWILLAAGLALFVGRVIKLRDQQRPDPPEPTPTEPNHIEPRKPNGIPPADPVDTAPPSASSGRDRHQ